MNWTGKPGIAMLLARTAAHRAQRITWEEMQQIPVACWDIETTNLSMAGGIILCGAIKPLGQKAKIFRIDHSPDYQKQCWNDKWLVRQLRDELEKYVVVIHHYGDRFDVPALQTRLLYHHLRALQTSRIAMVDTWWMARYRLRLHSNRLGVLSDICETKAAKTPLELTDWTMAAAGQRAAMDKVVKHNLRDVLTLEEVVQRLAQFTGLKYTFLK